MAASIPTLRVKRLRGSFERDHRGPVERPRAIAEIETVAALTRARNLGLIDKASVVAQYRARQG